jgi:hypothetical protein
MRSVWVLAQHQQLFCLLLPQVKEETGLDIEDRVDPSQFIEATVDGKLHKLFIVRGVDPETTVFAPLAQKVR